MARQSCIDSSTVYGEVIVKYRNNTTTVLSNLVLDHDTLICTDITCTNKEHMASIDKMYTQIINALYDLSTFLLPNVRTGSNIRAIPGFWNEYVKEAHSEARDAFLLWQCNSKPGSCSICHRMKTTRARCKQCLKFCKSNEDRAKADALANNLLQKDNISFWKDYLK